MILIIPILLFSDVVQSRSKKTQIVSDSSESDGDWNWDKYNDDDEESVSKHKRRRQKPPVEESSSSESSGESFFVEKKRRRRRKSRVVESSSSESSEESSVEEKITRQVKRPSRRTDVVRHADSAKTTELRKRQRNIESWHEKEKERSKRNLMGDDSEDDMTVRKARSVMADYDEQKEGRGETQLALVTDIGEVLKALEEDRQKTEERLREVEAESLRLEMERDVSSRKVSDLKASQHNAELHIIEAKIDMETLKTGTKATASVKAKENMQLTSDLEATRQH
jgi:hypothetical protein